MNARSMEAKEPGERAPVLVHLVDVLGLGFLRLGRPRVGHFVAPNVRRILLVEQWVLIQPLLSLRPVHPVAPDASVPEEEVFVAPLARVQGCLEDHIGNLKFKLFGHTVRRTEGEHLVESLALLNVVLNIFIPFLS